MKRKGFAAAILPILLVPIMLAVGLMVYSPFQEAAWDAAGTVTTTQNITSSPSENTSYALTYYPVDTSYSESCQLCNWTDNNGTCWTMTEGTNYTVTDTRISTYSLDSNTGTGFKINCTYSYYDSEWNSEYMDTIESSTDQTYNSFNLASILPIIIASAILIIVLLGSLVLR